MTELSHETICAHLAHHGWIDDDRRASKVESAIAHYQAFHGLQPDGDAGPVTQTRIRQTTCGTKESEIRLARSRGGRGNGVQWPWPECKTLYYYANFSGIRGISADRAHNLYLKSVAAWEAVCGIKIQRTLDRDDKAHWVVSMGREGMRGSTLAWATLPIGFSCASRGKLMFNVNVTWDEPLFLSTAKHENGHIFGLDHNSSCSDLMCAYVNGKETIGQWSIDRMVPKYGKPVIIDDDDDDDDPAPGAIKVTGGRFTVEVGGEKIKLIVGIDGKAG